MIWGRAAFTYTIHVPKVLGHGEVGGNGNVTHGLKA